LNGFQNATGETLQTTPNDFLNFNYLFNPKEQDANASLAGLQLQTDPSYDPDGPNGPLLPGPGPFSAANNDNGQFSPQLILFVPEPASMALFGLGAVALLTFRRRN